MSDEKAVFRNIADIEPFLPDLRRAELAELSQKITLAIGELRGFVHAPVVREKITALVREMNCYYSNLIECHKTLPRDIERAQRENFSTNKQQKENQLRLGL